MIDHQLGYQHGRNGNESKYPKNANYMRGFAAGSDALMREIAALRPFEGMEYDGTNDAHIDQFHA